MGLQQLALDVGGTLEAYFLDGLPASVKLSLFALDFDDESSTFDTLLTKLDLVTATRDTVATTIAAYAPAGARQVTVASATGITVGRLYKIGTNGATEPDENVRVKSINGAVITLASPLVSAHTSAAAFAGLRVSYSVLAATPNYYWADGYAKWTSADAGDPKVDPVVEQVDCVRLKIPEHLIDMVDVRQVEPQIDDFLDSRVYVVGALREARDGMLMDFGRDRVKWALGSSLLKRAAALRFCLDRQHTLGASDEMARKLKMWTDDYANELNRLRKFVPADVDLDGIANAPDGDDELNWMAI